MILTFTNGTDLQKEVVRTTLHNLLGLPFDSISLELTVEFIANPDPDVHNEFAATDWSYDSNTALTKIASVAPNWPVPWDGMLFFAETVAHELGHALYAALEQGSRVAIAEMFGAGSDDIAELQPPGVPWEDRIMEGIAETFKDAFLPPRLRRYYNRTNKKIPISQYPAFRALWRQSAEQVLIGGVPLEPGEVEVPGYALDIFKQGGYRKTEIGASETPASPPGLEPIGHDDFQFLIGAGGFWDTFFQESYVWFSSTPTFVGSFLRAEFEIDIWVLDGTVLTWELDLQATVPFELDGTGLQLRIVRPVVGGKVFFDGIWTRADTAPGGATYSLTGDAVGFMPPTTVTDSMTVNSTNFGSTTRKCHGATYRRVQLAGRIEIDLFPHVVAEHNALREALLYPILNPFPFVQAKCSGDGEPGPPIVLEASSVEPSEASRGRRRLGHRVVGQHVG